MNFGPITAFPSSQQQEIMMDYALGVSSKPQSIDTIDQVHSMHRQSQENFAGMGFKCTMGLCCDNSKVVVSQTMNAEDICYI